MQSTKCKTLLPNKTNRGRKPPYLPNKMKANTYVSFSEAGFRNGSFYRVTGRKKEFAAHYINGDFMGFVPAIPSDNLLTLTKKEAKELLPACNR